MSRIEQLINEIEEFIDSCKYQPLSNTKILVNKEEIEELLVELRLRVPDEIKKYQKIVSQQDAILSDARAQAQNMITDAQAQMNEMVSDHEIMQRAYQKANEVLEDARGQAQAIIDSAVADANGIRQGAVQYTDSLLANVQNLLSSTVGESRQKYEDMFRSLESAYDICGQNRSELQRGLEQAEQADLQKKAAYANGAAGASGFDAGAESYEDGTGMQAQGQQTYPQNSSQQGNSGNGNAQPTPRTQGQRPMDQNTAKGVQNA